MQEKICVLQFIGKLGSGGIEAFVMNVFRSIDRTKINFGFVTFQEKKEFYDDEIQLLGGKKHVVTQKWKGGINGAFERTFSFFIFLKEHKEYKIVHIHLSDPARAVQYILIAKLLRRRIIVHSHATSVPGGFCKKIIRRINKYLIYFCSDIQLACSKIAANWMYPRLGQENVQIIQNAFDLNRFFNCTKNRTKMRDEYNLSGKYVIGNIGRLCQPKNQRFILNFYKKLCDYRENLCLLIVGDGELKKSLEEYVSTLEIEDKVIFAPPQTKIEDMYAVMDLFVLPSLYEGLGIVAVEAQVSGLMTLVSEHVPSEAQVSNHYLSIPLNVDIWVDVINTQISKKNIRYKHFFPKLKNFDIKEVSFQMLQIYESLK